MTKVKSIKYHRRDTPLGFSLVEAVISMVVVGVMLVAALNTLGGAAKARTINASLQRGPALAHQLMAEVLGAAYEEPVDTPIFGQETGETGGTREYFDDVDDFDAWQPTTVQTQDGTAIPNTTGWSRQVAVQEVDATTLASGADTGLKQITVTVTNPQGKTTTLVALRSQFSPNAQAPAMDTTITSAIGVQMQVGDDPSTALTAGAQILNQIVSGPSGGGGGGYMAVSDMIDVKRNGRIYASAGGLVVSTNSTLINKIKVMQAGVIDGDAYIGPGGNLGTVIQLLGAGQITGTTGVLTTAVDIPNFTVPDLGVSTGDAIYSSGTTTISGNMHCNNFQILNNAIVQISGDVTINSDLTFLVTNTGQLQLLPGATLTIYSNFGIKVLLGGKVNVNTADPSRLTINNLIKHVDVKNNGILYATVLSPNGALHVTNDAYFYGSFKGNQVKVDWNGQVCVQ